jgi:hypothetical protein
MHYTALAGTTFYLPITTSIPPRPMLNTVTLISIITVIITIACVTLICISVITNFKNNCKNDAKRLVLDCFMIDQNERILVKVDGTLPMKEIFHDLDSSVH